MSEPSSNAPARGRGKSRGGLGKYLRSRGRGRGRGRGAEFAPRLVLEHEQEVELNEDEQREIQAKYSSRGLKSNVDRYEEPEPDPDEEPEPEVDLTAFLERQRASTSEDPPIPGVGGSSKSPPLKEVAGTLGTAEEGDGIDHELEQIMRAASLDGVRKNAEAANSRKNNKQVLEWDDEMEKMQREKTAAEALRDLRGRLQGSKKMKMPGVPNPSRRDDKEPIADTRIHPSRASKPPGGPEAFLDDLLG